jgi:hypothetical protein
MQNDKEHLNVDLGFLDEAKPRETETIAKSGYKTNWRNIAIIGGLIVAVVVWVTLDDKSSAPGTSTTAPAYQAPTDDSSGAVKNGQFTCSRYDSDQAKRLSPTGESDLTTEKEALEGRRSALDNLKSQMNLSSVDQNSDQSAIDSYNAMVEQYNTQLESLKSDEAAYQEKVDQFNAQVQAHNDYLTAHCRSGG